MKKTILATLIAVIVTTPCFAQEVEPEGMFSVDGTLWRVCAIVLTSEEPHLSIHCDDEVRFYQGKAYINSIHAVFSWGDGVVSYTDLGVVSIAWAHCFPLGCYYLAIMQPTIGFGVLTYGRFGCGCNPFTGYCHCASEYVIGIMYKINDNWPPPSFGAKIHVPEDQPTIQAAINAASDNDTILVAQGVYTENIDYLNKKIVVASESGPFKTIIQGTGQGNVVLGATGSTIQGFTITGSGNSLYNAGIEASLASMTIRENIITGNWLGINTSNHQWPVIQNNFIHHNSHGGIVASFYSTPTIINNTIAFNGEHGIASYSGAGYVINNIIFSNGSNGIFCSMAESSPEITYNNVYGNELGDYSECTPGKENISVDPLFRNAADGDYHLTILSPCINKGTFQRAPHTDIDGEKRPYGYGYDMGADECGHLCTATQRLYDEH